MCGCNGPGGQTIAQKNSGAQARVAPGASPSSPMLLGDEGGLILRVRASRVMDGMRTNHHYYVTGTGVQPLLDDGSLVDISGITQAGRAFKVGKFTYYDRSKAERASAATGLPMIEVA